MVVIALLLVKLMLIFVPTNNFKKKVFNFFNKNSKFKIQNSKFKIQNSKTFLVHGKNKYLKKN